MPQRITAFGILVCLLLLGACRKPPEEVESEPPPPAQRKDLLVLNEAPHSSPFELHWGRLRIPLYGYGNPVVYRGELELDLNDIWQALGSRLSLYREKQELDVQVLGMHLEPWSRERRLWFSHPPLRKGLLAQDLVDRLRESIQPGQQLNLRLHVPAGNLDFFPILLTIRDPFAPYNPGLDLEARLPEEGVFGFQVLELPQRPPVLRMDTLATATRHIYQMYKGEKRYKILHIPGFQTRRRYVTEKNDLFSTKEIRRTELLCQEHDLIDLAEYVDTASPAAQLRWGLLEAAPSSRNYTLAEFRQGLGRGLWLNTGTEKLPVRQFHLYVYAKDRQPALFISEDLEARSIQLELARLGPESSVFFDRLVVEKRDGKRYQFPHAFGFHIGKEQDYTLTIEESATEGKEERKVVEQNGRSELQFRQYPLSGVLAELLGRKPEELLLESFDADPLLDVRFQSAVRSLEEARELLLHKLQLRYCFVIRRLSSQPAYALEVVDSRRLPLMAPGLGRPSPLASGTGFSRKNANVMELREVGRRLENEFSIKVVDRSLRGRQPYYLPLDYAYLESLRWQLPVFGLRLEPLPDSYRVLVSRW